MILKNLKTILLGLFLVFSFLFFIFPVFAEQQGIVPCGNVCDGDRCNDDCTVDNLFGGVTNVPLWTYLIQQVLGIAGIILLVLFIYAGVMYIFSNGSDKVIKKSQEIMKGAVIGIAIAFFAYAGVRLILMMIVGDKWSIYFGKPLVTNNSNTNSSNSNNSNTNINTRSGCETTGCSNNSSGDSCCTLTNGCGHFSVGVINKGSCFKKCSKVSDCNNDSFCCDSSFVASSDCLNSEIGMCKFIEKEPRTSCGVNNSGKCFNPLNADVDSARSAGVIIDSAACNPTRGWVCLKLDTCLSVSVNNCTASKVCCVNSSCTASNGSTVNKYNCYSL